MKVFKKTSISSKLIWIFIILWCLPVIAFFVAWYSNFNETVEMNAVQSNQYYIKKLSNHIDFYFDTIKKESFPVIIHPLTQEFIQIDPMNYHEYYRMSKEINLNLFPNPIYVTDEIYGFHILSKEGAYYSNNNYVSMPEMQEMLNQVQSTYQNFHIKGASLINNVPVITVYRKIVDLTSYETAGVLILDIKLEYIQKMIDSPDYEKEGVLMIVDHLGNIISHPDIEQQGQSIHPIYMNRLEDDTTGFVNYYDDNDGKMIGVHTSSEFTKLSIIYEVPVRILTQPMLHLKSLTIGGMILFTILSVLTLLMFYITVMRPLFELLNVMKQVEMGNLNERARKRDDEIGIINRRFNHMLDYISELLQFVEESKEKEIKLRTHHREAALQSLQARINPHFLYNTLEIINSYAVSARNEHISQMVILLSKIFRYSIYESDIIVPLKIEIEHVANYLTIQKKRFRNLEVVLRYDDDEIEQVKVFKLIIQPIVENAFIHGYEQKMISPDYIEIKGEKRDYAYILKVIDRGGGMDAQLVEKYNEAFKQSSDEEILEGEQQFDKLGLWNVHTRLRLAFGKPYGLHIERSNEQGTQINVCLPYFIVSEE